jgi:pimeloyl-ACP methyl ester carboxylesterase
MYESYEEAQLWDLLANPPKGLSIDFVKAERSSFRWNPEDEARITDSGHAVHLLRNSGHWVHTDSPEGVMAIIETSFCRRNDVESIHASYDELNGFNS